MGIKGLKTLIKKNAPDGIQKIEKNDLKNKKLSIDSSILLYKFRYTYSTDNFHIVGFLYKIIDFMELGVIPIFVFDGKPPEAKQITLEKRNETRNKMKDRVNELLDEIGKETGEEFNIDEYICSEDDEPENLDKIKELKNCAKKIQKNILYVRRIHSLEVMELLKSLGIPFLQAPGESEQACAILQKEKVTDYVLTEDTDSLTFGGTVLFNNEYVYDIEKIRNILELSHESFIDMCILSGCDYTPGIPKIGPVSALKIIKKHQFIENFLGSSDANRYKIPENFDYQTSRNIFNEKFEYNIEKHTFNEEELLTILQKHNIEQIGFFMNKLKKINFNFNFLENKNNS